MINPEDKKGIEKRVPQPAVVAGVQLSSLPKYLSFKAATKHNELVLKHVLVAVLLLWGLQFSVDKYHDIQLSSEYRKKTIYLAPSEITGITPSKPNLLPPSYVDDISSIYLSLLGNVNALNVEDNYARLSKQMSSDLRIKFNVEVGSWIETVRTENISEVLKITRKTYSDGKDGYYRVSAIGLRERYTGRNYVGVVKEKIEMVLKIVAPSSDRRWFLQIDSLKRGSLQ